MARDPRPFHQRLTLTDTAFLLFIAVFLLFAAVPVMGRWL